MILARLRPAAAVLVTATAGGLAALAPSAPATAAACPGVSGVTVVVEYRELGGGVDRDCAAEGGGHTADRLLKETWHTLAYVQRFPGFVCRVDGLPAEDPCVNTPPADAYWGLWWSDGKTGKWTYSSLGAGSLTVPAGGYLAMVWDGSARQVAPGTDPAPHATPTPTPTRTASPTTKPTPTATPTTASPTPTATFTTAGPTATKKPKPKPSKTRSASPTPAATDEPTDQATDQATEAGGAVEQPPNDPPATTDDGLPGWMPPVLVAALLVTAGAVAVVRRRA